MPMLRIDDRDIAVIDDDIAAKLLQAAAIKPGTARSGTISQLTLPIEALWRQHQSVTLRLTLNFAAPVLSGR